MKLQSQKNTKTKINFVYGYNYGILDSKYIYNENVFATNYIIFRESACGFEVNTPKICCKIKLVQENVNVPEDTSPPVTVSLQCLVNFRLILISLRFSLKASRIKSKGQKPG